MEIIYLIIGLLLGAVLAYFFLTNKSSQHLESNVQKHPVVHELKQSNERLRTELEQMRKSERTQIAELASALEQRNGMCKRMEEQAGEVAEIRNQFQKEFQNLANKIFDEKSEKFANQNKVQLDLLLNPFKDKLRDFESKVEKVYNEENKDRINLKAEIKLLSDMNKQLSSDANNLATALKGSNKSQGSWGELILEKILERSGLQNGIEFKKQNTSSNDAGDKIRPDIVVYLPDGKHIVIDSKVSLIAYNSMIAASDDTDRERFAKAHVDSFRSHVKLLGDKNYQTSKDYITPDFVLLFTPIEAAFGTAMQHDNELYNFAWDRKIIIVSPTTLLATLRTVASMWNQEKRTKNAEAIAEEAGKLYDKFVGFLDDLVDVGKKLDSAQKTYEDSMNKLYLGTGNLINRAQKMKKLGAKTTKEMNAKLAERASDDDTNEMSE
jgi:DNA recombination protein RmuC